jgi:CBS domain-containing protein
MLVESLMTRDAESCRPESSLAEAAAIMWRRDCGAVPVVDAENRPAGIITDRDICMALSLRGQRAAEVRVGEVMAQGVRTCTSVDDVREALELMRGRQLRRLPVVNGEGKLVGILSISDIVRHTKKGKGKKHVSQRDTLATLKAICRPRTADADDASSGETASDENEGVSAPESEGAGAEAASGGA